MAYFDPQLNVLKPELYTWDDTNDSSANWANASTWEDWLGTYSATAGEPDLVFTTDIIDFGRLTNINPLCTVVSSGTHVIKVFAAEQIDSSSLLPGDPVIDTSDSTVAIPGQYGRYFQFRIEVFDGAESFIRSVTTDLNSQEQSESFVGNSNTHPGTTSMRYAPITKEYSKLTALTGNAKATTTQIPIVTVGSLDDNTQPRYKVYTVAQMVDSSTVEGEVTDVSANNKGLTVNGASVSTATFKWSPYGVNFTANQNIQFDGIGVAGSPAGIGDFTLEGWIKIIDDADYFLKISDSANDYRLRTTQDSAGLAQLEYSTNGGSTYTTAKSVASTTDFIYWNLVKNSNTISLRWGSTGTAINGGFESNNNWDMDNMIIEIGADGTGEYFFDDIRYSKEDRYFAGFSAPSTNFIDDSNTLLLVNGATDDSTIVIQELQPLVQATDAEVSIHVRGLPKMVISAEGNIVEQTP